MIAPLLEPNSKKTLLQSYQSSSNGKYNMYSPNIDKHTPNLYRLAKAVGKPMTKVAVELISFSLNHLQTIYELNEKDIAEIIQKCEKKKPK
ncbi:hypothetical protein [Marinicella sp. W31]|uniref:hypothetical protein n=1 Tax=Marinicella sp. W31 TaxID=3023713 RepID=UPI0037577F24